jgi:hypothetical protein
MEALPRFNASKARFTTFIYGLARRRMWLVARAAFYGLSPEQMHRLDAAKRTPRFHYDVDGRRCKGRSRGFAKSLKEDGEERLSVKRVDAIRRQLSRRDQRLIDLYLQEGGNYSAVARRLRRHRTSVSDSYCRLFHRIKASG